MIEEREELMVSPTNGEVPTLKKAHFLKPTLKPRKQHLPHEPPSASLSSNPNINDVMKKRVLFKGRVNPQSSWKTWVYDLAKTHQNIWKKVGIFDAIRVSTYNIKKHNELIIELAQKWCPKTNTFIFSWGEATITLEDVMILGGFSVLGFSVLNPSENRDEFGEIEAKLVNACSEIRRNCKLVTQNGWMNYFKGSGGELEHVAFLVLWLSRYVFPTDSYNIVAPNVYLIGISLARGVKIALAPAVLAQIYRDLTLLKDKFVSPIGEDDGSKLSLCAQFHLVQLWAWERFPIWSPKPNILQNPSDEPRLARWDNIEKPEFWGLRLDLDSSGVNFLWRPYALCLKNSKFSKFYSDNEMWVLLNSKVDEDLLSFARCLRPCELVGVDCVEQYSPHRVGLQFGMDQDIPDCLPRLNHDLELAWSSYDKPLDGLKLYLPPRLLSGDVTVKYSNWWRKPLILNDNDVCESSRIVVGFGGGSSRELPMKNPSCSEVNNVVTTTQKEDKEEDNKKEHLEGKEFLLDSEMEELCCVNIAEELEQKATEEMNINQMYISSPNGKEDKELDRNVFGAQSSNLEQVRNPLDDVVVIHEEEQENDNLDPLSSNLEQVRNPLDDVVIIHEEEQENDDLDPLSSNLEQVRNPLDDVVVIHEEEQENDDLDPFGARGSISELEARIIRLEGLVSMLRAAKSREKLR